MFTRMGAIAAILVVLCVRLHTTIALQEVVLNSTLYLGQYARPGQRVTFTCEARDASILEWYSDEYIGTGGDRIEILRNGDGSDQTRHGGETVATTVSVNTYSGVTVIISQLHIMTSEQIPTSSVMCAINGAGPRKAISFTTTVVSLQNLILNHTLFLGEYARPRQRVTFTCEARDASILEWYSDEYIGTGGDRIEILRNGDGSDQTRHGGETVATTVSVNTYSGVTVIISQLHIMTSEQIPTSLVLCAINGAGPRKVIPINTTAVSLQNVILNHTLFLGEYARPGQRVTFTCEARDASILEWHSEEYIGTGGDRIEILRNGDGSNQTRHGGETVATTVSVNTYSGVTVIISQLHIMTSEQIPTSSVLCAINGAGPRKAISFTTTDMDLSTDSIPEITSTSESIITTPDNQFHTTVTTEHDSDDGHIDVIAVIAGLCCGGVIIAAVFLSLVVVIMCARTRSRRKSRVGSNEMLQEQQPDDVTDKKPPATPVKETNEEPDDIETLEKSEERPLLEVPICVGIGNTGIIVRGKETNNMQVGLAYSTSLPSIVTYTKDEHTYIRSSSLPQLSVDDPTLQISLECKDLDTKQQDVTHDEGHSGAAFEDSGVDDESSNGSECDMESQAIKKREQVDEGHGEDSGVDNYSSNGSECEMESKLKKCEQVGEVPKPKVETETAQNPDSNEKPNRDGGVTEPEDDVDGEINIQPTLCTYESLHEDLVSFKRRDSDYSELADIIDKVCKRMERSLKMIDELISGEFGTVDKGIWESPMGGMDVAVKQLQPRASVKEVQFLEAATIRQLRRPNFVKLVTTGEPPIVAPCTFYGQVHNNSNIMFMWRSPTPITGFGLAQQKQRKLSNKQSVMSLISCWRDNILTGYEDILGYSYFSDMQALTKKKPNRDGGVIEPEDDVTVVGEINIQPTLCTYESLHEDLVSFKISDLGISRIWRDESYYNSGRKIPVNWTAPEGKKGSRGKDGVNRRLGPLGSPGKWWEPGPKGNAGPFGRSGHLRKTGRHDKKDSRGKDDVNRRLGPLGSPGKWREPGPKGNAEPFEKSGHFRKTRRPSTGSCDLKQRKNARRASDPDCVCRDHDEVKRPRPAGYKNIKLE